MLRAILGKVVHITGTYAAKVPLSRITQNRCTCAGELAPSPFSCQLAEAGFTCMERRKTQRAVRKVDIPAVIAGEGELEPIKTTAEKRGPATKREDRIRGQ